MGGFISLRIPKKIMGRLHRLKAKLMLKREEKVSDAEVVSEAIDFTLKKEKEFFAAGGRDLMDYCGFIRGKPSNAAEDHNIILYGRAK